MCDKKFKYIDAYWKHVKRCGQPKGVELTPRQASMMVTRKSKADKHTCANCGRDFFHEVNWKKHEEMCKAGRVKSRAIYKQQVGQASTTPKPAKKEKLTKVKKDQNTKEKTPKEIRECLICLKKVGTQVNNINTILLLGDTQIMKYYMIYQTYVQTHTSHVYIFSSGNDICAYIKNVLEIN